MTQRTQRTEAKDFIKAELPAPSGDHSSHHHHHHHQTTTPPYSPLSTHPTSNQTQPNTKPQPNQPCRLSPPSPLPLPPSPPSILSLSLSLTQNNPSPQLDRQRPQPHHHHDHHQQPSLGRQPRPQRRTLFGGRRLGPDAACARAVGCDGEVGSELGEGDGEEEGGGEGVGWEVGGGDR